MLPLALACSSRYLPAMAKPRLSVADALLRLWMLAEVGLAGLYLWLGWRMRDWPGDGPAPQPLSTVAVAEFMALFIIVPAAIVVVMRWRETQDRPLAGLALFYGLASAASLAAWAQADTAGMVQALFIADAAIALAGVPVALRALKA